MKRKTIETKQKVSKIGFTDEHLTSRGGLIFFIKYMENIGIYYQLEKLFGNLRKNKKDKQFLSDLCKFYSAVTISAFFQMESLNLG